MNEIKQDISSLRYELLEIFRNNKMIIPANERRELKGSKQARIKSNITSLVNARALFSRLADRIKQTSNESSDADNNHRITAEENILAETDVDRDIHSRLLPRAGQ